MRVPPALLVASALLAGCLSPMAADPSVSYGFEGVFMPTVGAADRIEMGDRVRAEGGELSIEEKLPPRFSAWGLTLDACEVVRAFAVTKLYIDVMGACEATDITAAAPATPAPVVVATTPGPTGLSSAPVANDW